ncbi:MAG: DUF5680 domain-containing protein [Candidatus Komeilibacteria bacterium]|nr:DUF5680 domain-containing protein [Candidatus Komeilibacteria bacterium]
MKLTDFITQAHRATYASGASPTVDSQGAHRFNYEVENFTYEDTYYGGAFFIGTEVVRENGRPIWGMNYYGRILNDDINRGDLFSFLREMLTRGEPGMLLRGPKKYKRKSWSYRYSYKGTLGNFTAQETIKYQGKKAYIAHLAGGSIE